MSLEKILILGVALLVVGGIYIFGDSLVGTTQEDSSDTAVYQGVFEDTIGGWEW